MYNYELSWINLPHSPTLLVVVYLFRQEQTIRYTYTAKK